MTIQRLSEVCSYDIGLFSTHLMILKVAEWPRTFSAVATVLAALVTQIFLGLRQVYLST